DRPGAMPYLQRASMRGEPRAQYIVGTALFNGDTVAKDWVRAYALMTRASASGLAQATSSLEQMDKYIPEDQRKQGLALAASMEKGESSAVLATAPNAGPTTPPRSSNIPSSVRTTELPPSTITPPAPKSAAAPKPTPAPQVAAATSALKVAPKPVSTPARPAASAPTPAASGDWRVQLGAFGEESRARALWSQLNGKVRGLSVYQLYLVKAGAVTRLQAGPIASAADAARLCSAVKAAGADCMPRKM
uniref:SPOR domain-containing protein n=1 Tax=Sphingobium sp. TaxID=1912891 RepID=UPI003B3B544F